MAIVDNMERIEAPQNRNKDSQSDVWRSEYFATDDVIQIIMYGSATRDNPEKVSQNVCFEGEALKQLANALQEIQDLNNKK